MITGRRLYTFPSGAPSLPNRGLLAMHAMTLDGWYDLDDDATLDYFGGDVSAIIGGNSHYAIGFELALLLHLAYNLKVLGLSSTVTPIPPDEGEDPLPTESSNAVRLYDVTSPAGVWARPRGHLLCFPLSFVSDSVANAPSLSILPFSGFKFDGLIYPYIEASHHDTSLPYVGPDPDPPASGSLTILGRSAAMYKTTDTPGGDITATVATQW